MPQRFYVACLIAKLGIVAQQMFCFIFRADDERRHCFGQVIEHYHPHPRHDVASSSFIHCRIDGVHPCIYHWLNIDNTNLFFWYL